MIDGLKRRLSDALRRYRHREEIQQIRTSPLFVAEEYRARLGGLRGDPAAHYFLHGEAANVPPSEGFDPGYYRASNPDVAASCVSLLLHFQQHGRAEGRAGTGPVAASQLASGPSVVPAEAIELIASAPDFDVDAYSRLTGKTFNASEAALHYLTEGEAADLAPSAQFQPRYYRARYPDVAATGVNLYLHFIKHGREEGRSGVPMSALQDRALEKLNPDRETVILVVHETSRTGAPILGLNLLMKLKSQWGLNVIVISWRGGGDIEQAFVEESDLFISPPSKDVLSRFDMDLIATRLVQVAKPRYCIANSAVAHDVALSLTVHGVPTVGLVHEFATLFHATTALRDYFKHIGAVVFPTEIVRESAVRVYPFLEDRPTYILPQGKCTLPAQHSGGVRASVASGPADLMKWGETDRTFTVAGLGTVEWRKGVDLFLSSAASFRARFPDVPCRFVWIGDPGGHSDEMLMYLGEQKLRSDLAGSVLMLPATADLEGVYQSIDVLYVSSRLDPLPNVAIDAMSAGIPVVSFDKATGVADALRTEPELAFLIAPYADAHTAAGIIHQLASDPAKAERTQFLLRDLAARMFDMDSYVTRIDKIARDLAPSGVAP
ncbi:glycosyltransferase family 4 protein [Pseudacidovorax intermedius]|uniref:Glycosyltransferase involved in cell wall biosynthesis n=1 Tax=Pseudacidovorax intermedius TaxID=433924 RepID=A0A147GVL8_9BURK|nr:glycosyltransferase family 4 protein [Pseudacidovorax intermedius]KTT21702.1 hypothetical protein NS331_11415 [Pseudacidovorax intermedius]